MKGATVVLTTRLLATKLRTPSIPAQWVQRPRLIHRLDEGLKYNRPFSLVSAPAGYGKTILVAGWTRNLDRLPVAWLSLDSADDDPRRFFGYLIAALRSIDPRLGQEIEELLSSGQIPAAEALTTTLVNQILDRDERFLLVLDDFHVIQDDLILQAIEGLIATPPRALHIVLVTREDPPLPLARLRAKNQMTEIRARDLRFTTQETARFLKIGFGLSLSYADIAELEDKTEGWIAGLQLAGLSIRDRGNPSKIIAGMTGSHRFVMSYLAQEVLAQQPEEIQQFLLSTAILDRFNADLCGEITGHPRSRELLDQLYEANLFLISLDEEGRWYRYHRLFADLLRDLHSASQGDRTLELHRRASCWYALADMASEAIHHALAARDYATAVGLLEGHAMEMVMQGYAKTVSNWKEALPEEWRAQSPRTDLAFAWAHLIRGEYRQIREYLERVTLPPPASRLAAVPTEQDASVTSEWLVMQSLMRHMEGRLQESKGLASRAIEIVPEKNHRVLSLAYFALASVYHSLEDYPKALDNYRRSIPLGQSAHNPVAEMMSTVGLARLAFEHAQLHLAFEILNPVGSREEISGSPPPMSTVIYGLLGEVHTQWWQLPRARRHFLRALRLSTLSGSRSGMINCRVLLSRLSQLEGDLDGSAREIQSAIELIQDDTPDYVRQEAVAQQVRVHLAQNRPTAAEVALQNEGVTDEWQSTRAGLPADKRFSHSLGRLFNSSLQVSLYRCRAGGHSTEIGSWIEAAGHLIEIARQRGYNMILLETLLLRAQLRAELDKNGGGRPAYQADILNSLEFAEPEGILATFVEQGPPLASRLAEMVDEDLLGNVRLRYVERILTLIGASRPAGATVEEEPVPEPWGDAGRTGFMEPLTDRELDVLRLMAEGLKYKEIGARLFISLNTVRYHVKALYGKLGVNNRTQAIAKSKELRIL